MAYEPRLLCHMSRFCWRWGWSSIGRLQKFLHRTMFFRGGQTCNNYKMVWSFPFFSFKKALILREVLTDKLFKKVWNNVEKCEKSVKKVWKSAETILPFSCCPLVFLWCFCSLLSSSERVLWVSFSESMRTSILQGSVNRGFQAVVGDCRRSRG